MRYVVEKGKEAIDKAVRHSIKVYPILQRSEDSSEDMLCLHGLDHLRIHLEEAGAHWMLPKGSADGFGGYYGIISNAIDVFYLHGVCIAIYQRVHKPGDYTFDAGPQCSNRQTLEPQRACNEIELRSWEVEFVSECSKTLRKVIRDIIESDDGYINFFKEAYSEGLNNHQNTPVAD